MPNWLTAPTSSLVEIPDLPSPNVEPVAAAPAEHARTPKERTATFREAVRPATDLPEPRPLSRLGEIQQLRERAGVGLGRPLAAAALVTGLLLAVQATPSAHEEIPSADVVRAYSAIDRLRPGDTALVVFDYPATRANSLAAAEESVLRHLGARGVSIVAGATRPDALERLPVLLPKASITNLGPLRGDLEEIRRLGLRDGATGAPTDSALRRATAGRPVDLMLIVTEATGDAARWLGNLRPGAAPAGVAVIAGGDPTVLAPLRAAGQMTGNVRGSIDLPGYAAMAGRGDPPVRGGQTTTGPVLAAGFVGLIAIFARLRWRLRRLPPRTEA
ncbi:MAG: hypothetical protein U0556_02265 [Dehalococcoidia bacterium]